VTINKGTRVLIHSGKYAGQSAVLVRRWPGTSNEWTIVLDGSWNTGIVTRDQFYQGEPRGARLRRRRNGAEALRAIVDNPPKQEPSPRAGFSCARSLSVKINCKMVVDKGMRL
jgi:hypothetical protein